MTFKKPFHRVYRPVINKPGLDHGYSSWAYIIDGEYAQNPEHYVRGFLLIQEDLQKLFEYIEPSDINIKTYSFRIHELFMRTCIELEANFKAILKENIFTPTDKEGRHRDEKKWNISDYRIIDKTHFLSDYSVEFPVWNGEKRIFHPFKEWEVQDTLSWYQAYNNSKHDRHAKFSEANFENLLLSVSGLFVLLSSQFRTETFSPRAGYLKLEEGRSGIGDYLIIEFPDYEEETLYDFNWSELMKEENRFEKIDYNGL